uniref:Uncharacterized protein n=1 Tax=Arundo donax TaxID=35708 RepID=A0A0A9DHP1_ARUDO
MQQHDDVELSALGMGKLFRPSRCYLLLCCYFQLVNILLCCCYGAVTCL